MERRHDFDILEIPLEGVAAYWLSLKKLVGKSRNLKMLEEEAGYTTEPFVTYLLELTAAGVDDARLERLARVREERLAARMARQFDLMRMALLDMAGSENPRKTVAKMTAQFSNPPLTESKAFHLAQELISVAHKPAENAPYFNVHHSRKPEKLIVTLLFYVLWTRREGKMACQPFVEVVQSPFFSEGLALVIDGFDEPFVRKRLRVHRDTLLQESRCKMDLSLQMCLDMKARLSYEDMFRAAKAYLE